MCGICGELSVAGRAPVNPAAVEAMTLRIPHRGPDHGAVFTSDRGQVGLGFRRLSIIDLRSAANQPIGNEDGSVQLVFNGEIYNYRDLRPGLVERGHQFRSNSDSEVIVHLFEPDPHFVPGSTQEPFDGGQGRFFSAGLIGRDGLLTHTGLPCQLMLGQARLVPGQSDQTGGQRRADLISTHRKDGTTYDRLFTYERM